MKKLSELLLPPHVGPDLAHTLAHYLVDAEDESPEGLYLALCFMHASWTRSEPATMRDYVTYLAGTAFNDGVPDSLELMANIAVLAEQGEKQGLSSLAVVAAQHAVLLWTKILAEETEAFDEKAARRDTRELLETLLAAPAKKSAGVLADLQDILDYFDEDNIDASSAEWEETTSEAAKGTVPVLLVGNGETPSRRFASGAEAVRFLMEQANGGSQASAGQSSSSLPIESLFDPAKPHLAVYEQKRVATFLKGLPPTTAHGEGNAQQRKLLEAMVRNDGVRNLAEVPEGAPLQELYARFPHFSEVLDLVSDSLALAACGDEGSPVRIPPILLRGAPGTGKTYFAQELARVLGTHFVERDLSVTSEAWVISGMDASWKNSKQGVVFDALVNGKTANPLICLNEVDKCTNRGGHNSPIASMYALLEPTSASQFVDEFIPLPLDASRVLWVLTANAGEIPEPVLSRLEVFDIPEPTREQCRAIAGSVWDSLCAKTLPRGHGFVEALDAPLLDAVSAMSPRVMRKVLTRAASTAASQRRKYLTSEDLAVSRKRYPDHASSGRRIGFVQA